MPSLIPYFTPVAEQGTQAVPDPPPLPAMGAGEITGSDGLLAVVLSGVGVVGVPVNEGVTPAVTGVTGITKPVLLPADKGPAVWQFTCCPEVEQAQPLFTKNAGAVTLAGSVVANVIGPVAEAAPMLLTDTGMLAGTPTDRTGIGPIAETRSGTPATAAGAMADGGTTGVEVLLAVVLSGVGVAGVPVKIGVAPAVTGITGIANAVLLPAVNGPAVWQLTV